MKKVVINDESGNIETGIYDRIISALKTRFFEAGIYEVVKPVFLHQVIKPENLLLQLNKGTMEVDDENKPVKAGEFYFVPAGKRFSIRYGGSSDAITISSEEFPAKEVLAKYQRPVSTYHNQSDMNNIYTMVSFGATLHDAASFFNALDLIPVLIPPDNELSYFMRQICLEEERGRIGRQTLIENFVKDIVIHICRYLGSLPEFNKHIERVEYLLDERIVDIILYIQNNLDKDLSNKSVAGIAHISEDYAGQFFKSLTHRNLQDYVEDQRLEKAKQLLCTTSLNVQEIARRVGFKDPAYFSRRFKIRFGDNANAIRNLNEYAV